MSSVAFCIVLYRYNESNSPTLVSLKKNGVSDKYILIHDNSISNLKLSVVYNNFISQGIKCGFEYLIFLDDDTYLNADYIEGFTTQTIGTIHIPKLMHHDDLISPLIVNGCLRFCMSGLKLHIKEMIDFRFNEDYSLYGIDDFLMLYALKNDVGVFVSNAVIEHELSTFKGIRGNGDYNTFKCVELLRAHTLNFAFAPVKFKFFYLKRVAVFALKLLMRGHILLVIKTLSSPGNKVQSINGVTK